jgi:hypothetical protein
MGKWVLIPWIGGQNTMGRGRYTMGKVVDIPRVGGQNTMDGEGVKIPWIEGSKYYGYGGRYIMGRWSKYHG